MKSLILKYKEIFTIERKRSFGVAVVLLTLSMIFQAFSSIYSTRSGTRFVGDLILDNIPAINLNSIIVEGALWAILFSGCLLLLKPKYIIFTLKSLALLITLRSFFISVTHLGIYPDQILPSHGLFDQLYVALNFPAGYFFSAHTAIPFLLALIFWKEKIWRYIFLIMTMIFGVSVLLAHVHYSIDVFAAPFMTYSIFKISQFLFREDYSLITHHTQETNLA